ADEAHHYFSKTKSGKRNLSKSEIKVQSWEETINNILKQSFANRLIGFSATFNLKNDLLFEKLKDKIVYQYDLKCFMQHGYAMNLVLRRSNDDDNDKMLYAMLLSQYRKYIARSHDIELKPIILFKSNKIATSKAANTQFFKMVDQLDVIPLGREIAHGLAVNKNSRSIWNKMLHNART